MTIRVSARSLRVALDAAVAPSRAEVVYVLTTLLEIAGYSAHFSWAPDATSLRDDGEIDIYYGPRDSVPARLSIASVPWPFSSAPQRDATAARVRGELDVLLFPGEPAAAPRAGRLEHDIIFASYWLLTGAPEPKWPRSRWDDLQAEGSLLVQSALLARAPVSRYAIHLRRLFESLGVAALRWPWENAGPGAAFAFTHDVDYPQIIRWIEIPRELLRGRPRLAWGIASGTQHFWKFRDWVDLARRFGARPTFYFMARRGSLFKFARGIPDAFYDVRTPAFRQLFAELKDTGCEIGLHASFAAYRSADVMRNERERIETTAQVKVQGNRHHYWHLDPGDPNETLRRHELAGFAYDSSLGLEYYPGWRRGICHPFRPYHPGERRAIDTVQVPPTWMDDHFDRRRSVNHIGDPDAAAKTLLDTAKALGGTCVVDYHARGMNADFFPRYGAWLTRFADREFGSDVRCMTAAELASAYRERASALRADSRDDTLDVALHVEERAARVELAALAPEDVDGVATLHYELFGDREFYGHSVALLGRDFLARGFYALLLDSPDFGCDVARVEGRVVGFSVYATNKDSAFTGLLRRHPVRFATAALAGLLRHPETLGAFLTNLRYWGGERLTFLDDVQGWWILAGVHPDARTLQFERNAGVRIAVALGDRMERAMIAAACPSWYAVPRADNKPINALLERRGAREVGMGTAQGVQVRYRVKRYAAQTT